LRPVRESYGALLFQMDFRTVSAALQVLLPREKPGSSRGDGMTDRVGAGRAAVFGAGLLGFGGVAAAAASAHAASDPQLLGAVALVCLGHAPVLLAIGLSRQGNLVLRLAALLLFAGAALFSADIGLRVFGHDRLFPMAAPTGGTILLLGWLAVAVSALTTRGAAD
jgi:uncharacterized membrane protein YgdD (TMEM256/DUF423 family)